MSDKIFISYRRGDAKDIAARIHDRLATAFGSDAVFMDVDKLVPGQRFDIALQEALSQTKVLIAVIGPRWLELLNARSSSGESDFVLDEISAALARGVEVIPVLLDETKLPKADQLPVAIQSLVLHQCVDVSFKRFGRDVSELIDVIAKGGKVQSTKSEQTPWRRLVARLPAIFAVGTPGLITAALVIGYFRVFLDPALVGPVVKKLPSVALPKGTEEDVLEKPAGLGADRTGTTGPGAPSQAPPASAAVPKPPVIADIEPKPQPKPPTPREPEHAIAPGSGESFRDMRATNTHCPLCPQMVVVPAASFRLGSPVGEAERKAATESPQQSVRIDHPFTISRHPVTRAEFAAFVGESGYKVEGECYDYDDDSAAGGSWKAGSDRSWRSPGFRQGDDHPVVCVSWNDAKAYTAWLERVTGKPYRLPTETEREYATRAGTWAPYWWGATINPDQANYKATIAYGDGPTGKYRQATVSVTSFKPNPWGLFNVHGNVWDWTADCWNESHFDNPGDGTARTSGACEKRVIRGGGWNDGPAHLRSARREALKVEIRVNSLGFRVARALSRP